MRGHSIILAGGLCLGLAGGALAQGTSGGTSSLSPEESGTVRVPSERTGDVSSGSSGAIRNERSTTDDRSTLSDIKAGTSGATRRE